MSADDVDDPYLVAPGTIAQDPAEVQQRRPRATAFPLEVMVDADVGAGILVFLGKAQQGDPMSACAHPRTVWFLSEFARQIQNAATFVRAQQETVAGFQHCPECRALLRDRGQAVGRHLVDCSRRAQAVR